MFRVRLQASYKQSYKWHRYLRNIQVGHVLLIINFKYLYVCQNFIFMFKLDKVYCFLTLGGQLQLMQEVQLREQGNHFLGTTYVPVYVMLGVSDWFSLFLVHWLSVHSEGWLMFALLFSFSPRPSTSRMSYLAISCIFMTPVINSK